jgi:hypothetical protein
MHYRSHKWIDIPSTIYEIRRELRVRESVHTCMIFDNKYQNIDTSKFDTYKIRTLNSDSLVHLIDDSDDYKHGKFNYIEKMDEEYNIVKINRIKELKAIKSQELEEEKQRKKEIRENYKRLREEYYKKLAIEKEEKEANYRFYLVEREKLRKEEEIAAQERIRKIIIQEAVSKQQIIKEQKEIQVKDFTEDYHQFYLKQRERDLRNKNHRDIKQRIITSNWNKK